MKKLICLIITHKWGEFGCERCGKQMGFVSGISMLIDSPLTKNIKRFLRNRA